MFFFKITDFIERVKTLKKLFYILTVNLISLKINSELGLFLYIYNFIYILLVSLALLPFILIFNKVRLHTDSILTYLTSYIKTCFFRDTGVSSDEIK